MGVPEGVHKLHTPQLPLPGLVHKDGGETDVPVNQTTVCAQETYGFLLECVDKVNNSIWFSEEERFWMGVYYCHCCTCWSRQHFSILCKHMMLALLHIYDCDYEELKG